MDGKRITLALLLGFIAIALSQTALGAVKIYCAFDSANSTELCEKPDTHTAFSVDKGAGVEFKAGVFGNSAEIESDNDFLAIQNPGTSFPSNAGSVGFWVKPLNWSKNGSNNLLFYANKQSTATAVENIRIHYSGTDSSIGINSPSLTFSIGHIAWGENETPDYNFMLVDISDWFDGDTIRSEWHYLGFSWNAGSGSAKAFVDSVKKSELSGQFSFPESTQFSEMRIGTFSSSAGVIFPAKALFDELRIYDSEIDFTASKPGITGISETILSSSSAKISFSTSVAAEAEIKYWFANSSFNSKKLSSATAHSTTLDSLETKTYYYAISACNSSGLCGYTSIRSFNLATCTPLPTCGAWGACVNGTKKRLCTDSRNCVADYNGTQNCAPARECSSNLQCAASEKCTSAGNCEALSCYTGERIENHACVPTCTGIECEGSCRTDAGACCADKWNAGFESCTIASISTLEGLVQDSNSSQAAEFLEKAKESQTAGLLEKASAEAEIGISYARTELAKKQGKKVDKALEILLNAEGRLADANYSGAAAIAKTYNAGIEEYQDFTMIAIAAIIIIAALGITAFLLLKKRSQGAGKKQAREYSSDMVVGEFENPSLFREETQGKKQPGKEKSRNKEEEILEKLKESLANLEEKKQPKRGR